MPDLRRRFRGYMLASYLAWALIILTVAVLYAVGFDGTWRLLIPAGILIYAVAAFDYIARRREYSRKLKSGEFGWVRTKVLGIYLDNSEALAAEIAALRSEVERLKSITGSPADLKQAATKLANLSSEYARTTARLAGQYYRSRNWGDAIAEVERLLRYVPTSAAFHSNLSLLRRHTGRSQQAISHASEAIRLDPSLAAAYNNRGSALMDRTAGNVPDHPAAAADFDQAIRLDPDRAEPYHNRAVVRSDAQDTDGALADVAQALQRDPALVETRYLQINLYSLNGDFETALALCNELLHHQAHAQTPVLVRRASIHLLAGDLDSTLSDLDEALRLNPKDADAHLFRALAYNYKERYADAVVEANQAIKFGGSSSSIYDARAYARFKLTDFRGAYDDWTHTLRFDQGKAYIYANRATASLELADYDAAIADCDTAIRIDPGYVNAHANRGAANYARADYDAAIADCDTAIRLDPKSALAYANRAAAHFALGHGEDARSDCEAALLLEPSMVAARVSLALLDFHEGHIAESQQRWQALIADEPRYGDIDWVARENHMPPLMHDLANRLLASLPPAAAVSP